MDDALLVRRLERVTDLPGDGQSLVDRHRPDPEPFGERLPFDELEHESFDAVGFHEPVDRADVRMVERGQKLGFPLEPRQPLGVLGDRLGKDFDREVPVQLGVARSVDLPHPSGAEGRENLVGSEASAGDQSQITGSIQDRPAAEARCWTVLVD